MMLIFVPIMVPVTFSTPTVPLTNPLEAKLVQLINGAALEADIAAAVLCLEDEGGICKPALSPLIQGKWTLLHSSSSNFDLRNPLGRRVDGTTPGLEGIFAGIAGDVGERIVASSSPIQRAVTGRFQVTQEIGGGRVAQRVSIGSFGVLHLNAAARVDAAAPMRISFAFDEGYFESQDAGLRLPYPVPFRLLGKEAEGFLDTSYLSDSLRISTGNKGTRFILQRELASTFT